MNILEFLIKCTDTMYAFNLKNYDKISQYSKGELALLSTTNYYNPVIQDTVEITIGCTSDDTFLKMGTKVREVYLIQLQHAHSRDKRPMRGITEIHASSLLTDDFVSINFFKAYNTECVTILKDGVTQDPFSYTADDAEAREFMYSTIYDEITSAFIVLNSYLCTFYPSIEIVKTFWYHAMLLYIHPELLDDLDIIYEELKKNLEVLQEKVDKGL